MSAVTGCKRAARGYMQMRIRLRKPLHAKLKAAAESSGRSICAEIEHQIETALLHDDIRAIILGALQRPSGSET